jgi:VWFA-related protein
MGLRSALLAVLLTFPLWASPNAQPVIPRAGETIDVSIVDFDVIVTDKNGTRVHGLTRDDFEVFEDKKPQTITNFAAYESNSAEREKRTIVLFIERYPDDGFRVTPTFNAIKKTLHEVVAPGDSVTIATWSGSPVIALQGSDDLRAIDSTLDAIAQESTSHGFRAFDRYDRFLNRYPTILDTIPRWRGNQLELQVQVGPYRDGTNAEEMRDQAAAINSLIDAVGDEGGRKAFLLMSRSLGPIDKGDYFYTVERRGVPLWRDYYRNSDIVNTIKATAAARNVPIYVFPLGPPLMSGSSSLPPLDGAPLLGGPVYDPFAFTEMEKIAALRDIARTSGGAYATGTDVARALPHVREDLSDYYSLAYRVQSRNDNHVRNVVVKTKKPQYLVRTRRQYIEKNDDIRVRDHVIASLLRQPAPSGIAVDAVVGRPVQSGRHRTTVPVSVIVPASSFMTSDAKGAFSVYIATSHGLGRASDITKRTVNLTADDLAKASQGKVEYHFDLVTEPDANLLSVAVYDEVSHDSGYARVDLPRAQER